jgi:hypothetical protein
VTPAEAVEVLARAAAYDQRTAGRADAEAWAAALPDIGTHEAIPAVARWYSRRRDRIMPADVRQLVTAARNDAWERDNPQQRALPERAGGPHVVDDAEAACQAWVGGWRQVQGDGPEPPFRLAEPVGRAAVAWSREGMSRADLCRAFWAAGRDAVILDLPGLERAS